MGEYVFVALELAEQKNSSLFGSIFAPVFNILSRPKASIRQAEAKGALFAILTARACGGVPDWENIAEAAGRYKNRMLLPDGLRPPEDCGIRELPCPRFEEKVLLATACEIVKRTRMPMYRRLLGIIDENAEYTGLLYKLLKHYTAVRVVTRNLDAYQQAADDMMERLGAPVLIGDSLSMLSDCVLVLAPGGAFGEPNGKFPCPVLAGRSFDPPQRCDRIDTLQISAADCAPDCPRGIAPHQLAAALYDYCGIEPDSFVATKMRYNYRFAELTEVIRTVIENTGISRAT